jgi:hypothetical protein
LEVIVYKSFKLQVLLFLLILCLPLIACGGAETPPETEVVATENAPTVNLEPAAPAEDVESRGTQVTEIGQIEGLWIASADPEIFYLMINPDGTVNYAPSLVDLDKGSTNTWTLSFQENEILADKFDLCLGEIGLYFGVLNPDGSLKFTSIQDSCDFRLRHMDRSLPGRIWDYNLVYTRVE